MVTRAHAAYSLLTRGLLLPWVLAKFAARAVDDFSIVGRGSQAPLSTLSGGNKHKVMLARELLSNHGIVVAMDPMSGLDVQAQTVVLQKMADIANTGGAVLYITTDASHVATIADSVVECAA